MQEIFLNYRRDDSGGYAGRLYDDLLAEFGDGVVFRDVNNIELGVDFAETIGLTIPRCKVVLIVIGKQWLRILKRRIDNPHDYMRIEVETALQHRDTIRVIPVLVQGATMPKAAQLPPSLEALSTLNAIELDDDPRWQDDLRRLVETIDPSVGTRPPAPPRAAASPVGQEPAPAFDPAPTDPTWRRGRKLRRPGPAAVLVGVTAATLLVGAMAVLTGGGDAPTEAVIARTASSVPPVVTTVTPRPEPVPTSTAPAPAPGPASERTGSASPPAGRTSSPPPESATTVPPASPPRPTPPLPTPPTDPPVDESGKQPGPLSIQPQSGPAGTVIRLSAGPCTRPVGWTGGEMYFGLSDPASTVAEDPVTGERDLIPGAAWQDQLVVPSGLAPGLYPVWANCFAWDPSTSTWKMFYLYAGTEFYVTGS